MSSFLGSPSSSSSADMAQKKEKIMAGVRQEIALAQAQELMNKASGTCFAKCVTKPGNSLSSGEETCLSRCFDRYLEAFNIVSNAYLVRVRRESESQQIA